MNTQPTIDEVCPNCGDWTETLEDHTGWCPRCAGQRRCTRCHQWQPTDKYRDRPDRKSPERSVCRTCERARARVTYHTTQTPATRNAP